MNQLDFQLLETVILLAVSLFIKVLATKSVNRFLMQFDFDIKRKRITVRIINLFLWIFIAIVLAGIWNINKEGRIHYFHNYGNGCCFFCSMVYTFEYYGKLDSIF